MASKSKKKPAQEIKSYEQWQMKLTPFNLSDKGGAKFQKVKLLLDSVMVTASEALRANSHFEHEGNIQSYLYLLPGEKQTIALAEIQY